MITAKKLLIKHQNEWDDIKAKAVDCGKSENEIDELYINYIDKLDRERHWIFGACFPRQ